MKRAGFTLLEVLVATLIMGIAVAALIGGLSQSVRNASRLGDYDRAAMLARTQINDLLADSQLPIEGMAQGEFDLASTNQIPTGWRAEWKPFDVPPNAGPGVTILQRVQLELWWQPAQGSRHTMQFEAFKRAIIPYPPTPNTPAAGGL